MSFPDVFDWSDMAKFNDIPIMPSEAGKKEPDVKREDQPAKEDGKDGEDPKDGKQKKNEVLNLLMEVKELSGWSDILKFNDDHDSTWFKEETERIAKKYGTDFIRVKYIEGQNGRVGYHCNLCCVEMNARQSLDTHCTGMKHLKKLNEWVRSNNPEGEDEEENFEPAQPKKKKAKASSSSSASSGTSQTKKKTVKSTSSLGTRKPNDQVSSRQRDPPSKRAGRGGGPAYPPYDDRQPPGFPGHNHGWSGMGGGFDDRPRGACDNWPPAPLDDRRFSPLGDRPSIPYDDRPPIPYDDRPPYPYDDGQRGPPMRQLFDDRQHSPRSDDRRLSPFRDRPQQPVDERKRDPYSYFDDKWNMRDRFPDDRDRGYYGRRSPSPRRRSLSPKHRSPSFRRRSPLSRQRSPSPRYHSRSPGRYSPSPRHRRSPPPPPSISTSRNVPLSPPPPPSSKNANLNSASLIERLAGCSIGTEDDAKLAREVVGLLLVALKEYFEAKGSAENVVLIKEAEVKFNILKALQGALQQEKTGIDEFLTSREAKY